MKIFGHLLLAMALVPLGAGCDPGDEPERARTPGGGKADTACDPSEYAPRGELHTSWLVSCEVPDENGTAVASWLRLQEMQHPTDSERCPNGFILVGTNGWYETRASALAAQGCGDCLYTPTYSEWYARCGGQEDFQIFQVVPEGAMPPYGDLEPNEQCPKLYWSTATGWSTYDPEAIATAPCTQ